MVEALAVATITILAVVSPGADFALVTRNSMVLSRRAGVLTATGIALGVLVHVAYSMAGIGLLIGRSMLLFSVIKFAGAAYLVYLGVTMLRASRADPADPANAPAPVSDLAALQAGFLTNALNPKTTLFVVVVYAFSSVAARRFVVSSRHLVERGVGAALVALGVGLAVVNALAMRRIGQPQRPGCGRAASAGHRRHFTAGVLDRDGYNSEAGFHGGC